MTVLNDDVTESLELYRTIIQQDMTDISEMWMAAEDEFTETVWPSIRVFTFTSLAPQKMMILSDQNLTLRNRNSSSNVLQQKPID